jgi:hypothetical protein
LGTDTTRLTTTIREGLDNDWDSDHATNDNKKGKDRTTTRVNCRSEHQLTGSDDDVSGSKTIEGTTMTTSNRNDHPH